MGIPCKEGLVDWGENRDEEVKKVPCTSGMQRKEPRDGRPLTIYLGIVMQDGLPNQPSGSLAFVKLLQCPLSGTFRNVLRNRLRHYQTQSRC